MGLVERVVGEQDGAQHRNFSLQGMGAATRPLDSPGLINCYLLGVNLLDSLLSRFAFRRLGFHRFGFRRLGFDRLAFRGRFLGGRHFHTTLRG